MTLEEKRQSMANARAHITSEQRKEYSRKGALVQQQNKTFRDLISKALAMNVPDKQKRKALEQLGFDGTRKDLIIDTVVKKAELGNLDAVKLVVNLSGEEMLPDNNVALDIGNIFVTQKQQVDYIEDGATDDTDTTDTANN